MKCQLFHSSNRDVLLENMTHIDVDSPNLDMFPNHSISQFLIIDTLSRCTTEQISHMMSTVLSKLRLNGEIVIQDIDLDTLCRNVFDKTLSGEEFNEYIQHRKCLMSLKDIKDIIKQNNLIIDTIEIMNNNYSIKCITRHE